MKVLDRTTTSSIVLVFVWFCGSAFGSLAIWKDAAAHDKGATRFHNERKEQRFRGATAKEEDRIHPQDFHRWVQRFNRGLQQQDPVCDTELAATQNCIASDFGCDPTCVSGAINSTVSAIPADATCTEFAPAFEPSFCSAIVACGCETCTDEYAAYFTCELSCFIQCDDSAPPLTPAPTPFVAPTAAPTRLLCPDELELVYECITNYNSCESCIVAAEEAIAADDLIICTEFSVGMCSAIKTDCECGDCGQVLEDFYGCLSIENGCGALDCNLDPTASPTEATAPSPIDSPPSPAAAPVPQAPSNPAPTTNEAPMAPTARGVDQPAEDGGGGGGISVGVVIGAIGGIVVVVGIIVGAILFSRRNKPDNTNKPPIPVGTPVGTSQQEPDSYAPSTPGRESQYPTPNNFSQNSAPVPNYSNVPSNNYNPNPIQGGIAGGYPTQQQQQQQQPNQAYNEPDIDIHSGNPPKVPYQPTYTPQETDVISSGGYSSVQTPSSSAASMPSQRQYHAPHSPSPSSSSYTPSYKDQAQTVLMGEPIMAEATPVVVQATPVSEFPGAAFSSVTSNAVSSSASTHDDSRSKRTAVDP